MKTLLTLGALLAGSTFASASLIVTGDLDSSDPTFNRPLASGSGLSSVGTAVSYDLVPFWVDATGNYTLELGEPTSTSTDFDTFLFAYSSFNVSTPLAGYLAGNDDYTGVFTVLPDGDYWPSQLDRSRINAVALTANTQYYAVVTSFDNNESGSWGLGIGGPGQVFAGAPVPEPASMVALGLGAAALLRRKRK